MLEVNDILEEERTLRSSVNNDNYVNKSINSTDENKDESKVKLKKYKAITIALAVIVFVLSISCGVLSEVYLYNKDKAAYLVSEIDKMNDIIAQYQSALK